MKRWPAILMLIAIAGVTGFQLYWLKNNYDREKENLAIETNASFRSTITSLQASKLKLENIMFSYDSIQLVEIHGTTNGGRKEVTGTRPAKRKEPPVSMINLLQERLKDSAVRKRGNAGGIYISMGGDSARKINMDSLREAMGKQFNGRVETFISTDSATRLHPDSIKKLVMNRMKGVPASITITSTSSLDSSRMPPRITLRKEMNGPEIVQETGPEKRPLHPGRQPQEILLENAVSAPGRPGERSVFRFLYDIDSMSLKDSVTVKEIKEAYQKRLDADKINIGFSVTRLDSAATIPDEAVTIGFAKPASYVLNRTSTLSYMLGKLKLPILFSVLLIALTIGSFVLLYRNMRREQRLGELKNEFISNITHELKTPIATVGVAIEALKSFNAIQDPAKTKEYLDISQNELHRLSLLVDKVLKLSMFEKKEIELKYESLNLKALADEVVASLKLQLEKHKANVTVLGHGNLDMRGDRLHLLSVIFNLLDNALKYSKLAPQISINLDDEGGQVKMEVTDNGIGIAPEYKDRIFDKFFRVPHGDTHDAKGYGLGLSYVAQVVQKHKGTITAESQPGSGTQFIITLPKQPA